MQTLSLFFVSVLVIILIYALASTMTVTYSPSLHSKKHPSYKKFQKIREAKLRRFNIDLSNLSRKERLLKTHVNQLLNYIFNFFHYLFYYNFYHFIRLL